MKRISLAIAAIALLAGCGETPAPRDIVEAAPVQRPAYTPLEITLRGIDEPLSKEEVLSFIDLIKSLPEGKPPTFTPVMTGAKVEGLHLDEAIKAWRSAVRNALTVETLIQGWSPKSQVRRTLIERGVSNKALASLMLRMSCTLGVEAMGGHRSVAAQRVITDEKIKSMTTLIQRMDRAGQPIADSYWQGLEEVTSLSEYLNVLLEVPPQNQLVVAEFHEQLQAMMPASSNPSAVSETREDTHVVPVRFDETAPKKPQPVRKSPSQRTR